MPTPTHRCSCFICWNGPSVDFELDVEELNARWSDPANIDSWGQLVIKHTADTSNLSRRPQDRNLALRDDGSLEYVRMQTHRRTVESEKEAFFLRISQGQATTNTREPTWVS